MVFGLGTATVLTLVFTPAMLALRIWFTTYLLWILRAIAVLSMGRASRLGQDWALRQAARKLVTPEIIWDDPDDRVDLTPLAKGTNKVPRLNAAE